MGHRGDGWAFVGGGGVDDSGNGWYLSGEYEHAVDEKGRVTLPSRMREALGEAVFVTRGLDGCLFVFSPERWMDITRHVGQLPVTKRSARVLSRMVFAGTRCDVDKAGRILLPAGLRRFAGIGDQVVVVGVEDRAELWAPDRWERVMSVLCDGEDEQVTREWETLDL